MAERLQTLIHTWLLDEEARPGITFSGTDIRMDPGRHVIELKADPILGYPTTGDQYVKLPLFQPGAVRTWLRIQAGIEHKDDGIDDVTGDGFRLDDGTSQWWWNGATWAVTTTGWNTEGEINAHIATFAAAARKLRLVVRLTTTDPRQTPTLSWAKVAWTGRVNWLEDIIYRSLVPSIRTVTSLVDLAVNAPIPLSTTVAMSSAIEASGIPFNVVDCNAVFNYTDDPDRLVNLLSSWNQTTKTATLTGAQTAGDKLIAELVIRPEVAVELTPSDYSEVEKVPAIVISDIIDENNMPLPDDGIVDKATGAAIRVTGVYRRDIRFSMLLLAAGGVDLSRMLSALSAYVANNSFLVSAATGRGHRLWQLSEFNIKTRPSSSDVHTAQSTFVIKEVLDIAKPPVYETAVMALNFITDR